MSISSPRLAIAVALICLVSPPSHRDARADARRGETARIDGVEHVRNPAAGIEEPLTLHPRELWRVGGETDDENQFFGLIESMTVDERGVLYLLDTQLKVIRAFSRQGEHLATFGREGEGPGEFHNPSDILTTPDGDVAVLQLFSNRLIRFTREGKPLDDLPLPRPADGAFILYACARRAGDHLVMTVITRKMDKAGFDRRNLLARLSDADPRETVYHEMITKQSFANVVIDEKQFDNCASDFVNNRWDTNGAGNIAFAPEHQAYVIHVKRGDGSPIRVIERAYKPLARTRAQIAERRKAYEPYLAETPDAEIRINDLHKDIMALHYRDNGEIWVLTSRGAFAGGEGVIGVFDVFDAEGRYRREVTLRGEGTPGDLMLFHGDRLFIATDGGPAPSDDGEPAADQPEPMRVICYELGI